MAIPAMRTACIVVAFGVINLGWPAVALAHTLSGRVGSGLPLGVYLAAAGIAVALSFAFVVLRDVRAELPPPALTQVAPRALVMVLRAIGLLGWLWIAAQTVIGGSGDADVASLFLWVYGWVGLAVLSALVGPVWTWLDPFATLYDVGAAVGRRLRLDAWKPVPYPMRLKEWPAVAGLAFFVWLELAYRGGSVGVAMLAYSGLTLVAMAAFGRDTWRTQGETFSVWFATLGRLAPWTLDGVPGSRIVRRRTALTGLIEGSWSAPLVALTAIAAGSILFDGLSQTQPWYDVLGTPALPIATLQLSLFLAAIVGLTLTAGRVVGLAAIGAGLLPISLGYLLAHYLTYLLGDGQRIVVVLSDPFQLGWNLLGTASYEPSTAWSQSSLVWSFQLVAVIGGHVVGAWAGHVVAARSTRRESGHRIRQLPLAFVMVALTTTTLWSLGQAAFQDRAETPQAVARIFANDDSGR